MVVDISTKAQRSEIHKAGLARKPLVVDRMAAAQDLMRIVDHGGGREEEYNGLGGRGNSG